MKPWYTHEIKQEEHVYRNIGIVVYAVHIFSHWAWLWLWYNMNDQIRLKQFEFGTKGNYLHPYNAYHNIQFLTISYPVFN